VLTVVTRRRLNEDTGKSKGKTTKTVKVVSAAEDSPLKDGEEFKISGEDLQFVAQGINMFFKLEKKIGPCYAGAAVSAVIPGLQAYTLYAFGGCTAWHAFTKIADKVHKWNDDKNSMIAACVKEDKHMIGTKLSYKELNEVCAARYSWF